MADKDFTVTVQIAAPPATVWAVLSDLEAWPSWTSKSMGVTTVADHILRPHDGGTEVSLVVEQSGLLAPLVALVLGKRGRRYVETEASGLKRAAEAAI